LQLGSTAWPTGLAVPERTRSELEHLFQRLCRRHRLAPPAVNVRIDRHLVDFLWSEQRLVVETDGYRHARSSCQPQRIVNGVWYPLRTFCASRRQRNSDGRLHLSEQASEEGFQTPPPNA
jgi:hypothetical protein